MAYDGPVTVLGDSWSSNLGEASFVSSITSVTSMGGPVVATDEGPAILKISQARIVPMTWHHEASPRTDVVENWLRSARECFDFAAISDESTTSLYLPSLIQKCFDEQDGKSTLSAQVNGGHAICGIVKFDEEHHGLRTDAVSCVIVGEEREPKRRAWQRRNKDAEQTRIYHLLVLDEVPVTSPEPGMAPLYRRVGVAQTIWAGALGYPIDDKAVSRDILII